MSLIKNSIYSILAKDSSAWNKVVAGRFYNTIGHGQWYYFDMEKVTQEEELVDVKYNGFVFSDTDILFKDFYHSELQDLNGYGHIQIISDKEFRASPFNVVLANHLRSTFFIVTD